MIKGFYLRKLPATMALVVLPLLVLQVAFLWLAYDAARAEAYQSVRALSKDAARAVEAVLLRAQNALSYVVGRTELKALSASDCSAILGGVSALDPAFVEVFAIARDGTKVCGNSVAGANQPFKSVSGQSWFRAAMQANGPRLSGPVEALSSSQLVLVVSLPIRATLESEPAAGLVGVSLSVEGLAALLDIRGLAADSSIALVSSQDRVLTRNPGPLQWVGRPVSAETTGTQFGENSEVVLEALGADGVERVFSSAPVGQFGLRVSAGIPVRAVYAPISQMAWQGLLLVLLAGAAAVSIAYSWARRLSQPLRALTETAEASARGDDEARAPQDLPMELGELSRAINQMLDARRAATEASLASEQRARRLARFYAALSKANQVIAGRPDPQALFEAVCRICVEATPAHMAWIGLRTGDQVGAVAWAGEAKAYAGNLRIPVTSPGPAATAVRTGAPCVIKDFMEDPRTLPWRERAVPFRVATSAAVPFRRGGVTVGCLCLYMERPEVFDDELVALLVEMAADISVALDSHQMMETLKQRDSQLACVIENARDAIVTVDALTMQVVVFNHAAVQMFGYSAEEVLGQPFEMLLPERHRGRHGQLMREYADEDVPSSLRGRTRNMVGCRKDGAEFPLEASISKVKAAGQALLTVMARDIAELGAAREARAAVSEAEAANKAKTEFLSRVSHELRTPLNAVIGFSQLLATNSRGRLDESERQQLDMICLAGNQLRALIDDVLDVSRIEAGNLSLTLEDLDLGSLLDGVLRLCESQADASRVALSAGYEGLPPLHLHTDPVRLRQVVLNLVSNAIKYNRPGGTVRLDMKPLPGRVEIRVSDTGLGMSREQMSRLFEPFNRLGRERSEVSGTGIGLLLSRQLVELMGGVLSLQSEEGKGTVATVSLPRGSVKPAAPVAVNQEVSPTASRTSALAADPANARRGGVESQPRRRADDGARRSTDLASAGPSPKGVILYIEDNPANAALVRQLFVRWPDIRLVLAESAATGLAQAQEVRPDLVLLDMHLPDGEGPDVLRQLRALEVTVDTPIAILSASVMPQEQDAAFKAGATRYWRKPIEFGPFLQGVAALLGKSHSALTLQP